MDLSLAFRSRGIPDCPTHGQRTGRTSGWLGRGMASIGQPWTRTSAWPTCSLGNPRAKARNPSPAGRRNIIGAQRTMTERRPGSRLLEYTSPHQALAPLQTRAKARCQPGVGGRSYRETEPPQLLGGRPKGRISTSLMAVRGSALRISRHTRPTSSGATFHDSPVPAP